MGDPLTGGRVNTRAGWYSVLVNLLLFGLNLAMAAYSGSLAMRAETAHNLMDLAASLSVLLGMALSERKSRDFPYGLYKLENVVAVLIAFGLFLTGYEIAREAVFAPPRAPDVRPVMLAGVALALLIPLAFSRYELRIGRAINSPSLIADANEFRAHILSSGVVFAGLAGQLLGLPLDRAAALLVVFWVGYVGWRTLVEGMRVLLDASLDAATLEAVRAVIAAQPEVAGVKTLTGRNSGRYRFIEAEVAVRVTDLEQAHRVATLLEEAIRAEVPHVERVLDSHRACAARHPSRGLSARHPRRRSGPGAWVRRVLCSLRGAHRGRRRPRPENPPGASGRHGERARLENRQVVGRTGHRCARGPRGFVGQGSLLCTPGGRIAGRSNPGRQTAGGAGGLQGSRSGAQLARLLATRQGNFA